MQNHDLRTLPAGKYLRSFSLAVLGALCAFQVAASRLPDLNRFGVTQTGNSAKIGPVGSGGSWGSEIPISPTPGGWSYAGNYGIPQAATGTTMNMGHSGDVFFSGTKYPFQAAYTVPGTTIVDAIGAIAGGPIGIGLFALPFALDWLTRSGGRVDPGDSTKLQLTDPSVCTVAPCYDYNTTEIVNPHYASKSLACDAVVVKNQTGLPTGHSVRFNRIDSVKCYYDYYSPFNGYWVTYSANFGTFSIAPKIASWLPSSMDDIAPYMKQTPFDPRVIGEVLDKGGDIPFPAPTITGPSEILGPTTETQNPDGTKTVSQPKSFFTFQGDTITNTKNETTVTVINVDNSIQSTTKTTVTPVASNAPEKAEDPCISNPDRNGCRKDEFDVPDGEIPKTTKTITFAAENLGFAGGSCPANRMLTIHQSGQTVIAGDWATTCDMVSTYARPMVLVMATFAAMMIIFGFGSGRSES